MKNPKITSYRDRKKEKRRKEKKIQKFSCEFKRKIFQNLKKIKGFSPEFGHNMIFIPPL